MKRLWLAWLCLLAFVGGTQAAGLLIVDEAHWRPPHPPSQPPPWPRPPRPLPPEPRAFAPLEISRYHAKVRILDQIAETSVQQDFRNPNDLTMEGTFLFPIPRGAQLKQFSMEINGQPAEAELLSAEQARQIYEEIVRKMKDPALLEFSGQDLFRVRVFPIAPRETKRFKITYTEVLPLRDEMVSFVHPLRADKYSARPIPEAEVTVELETRRPLKTLYSPSHSLSIDRRGDRHAEIRLRTSAEGPCTDLQLLFAMDADPIGLHLLTHSTGDDDGYFALFLSPSLESGDERVVPKDVVFVLDTSGSMAGRKLDQAKKALAFCVANLNDRDRFELIRFSTEVDTLFGTLEPATSAARAKADQYLQQLKPIGGTAIDAALQKALKHRSKDDSRPYVVIFLTDGLPTVGTTDEAGILARVRAANDAQTRIFSFGIGHDVNTHLLDGLTETTRAASQYVLPEEDLELKVSQFYTRIKDPVLMGPSLQFRGPARPSRLHPSPLPDLFRGDQLVIVGRYQGHGPSSVTLQGKVRENAWTVTHDLHFPAAEAQNDFLPRLWATRRVGHLLDELRRNGENRELQDEVTSLARQYGIVTPYTSYLIVEDEKQRAVPASVRTSAAWRQDAWVRDRSGQDFDALMKSRYGLTSVSRARSEQALQQAEAPVTAIGVGQAEAARGLAVEAPVPVSGRAIAGQAPATAASEPGSTVIQYAGGRTFYAQDKSWVDARIQSLAHPTRVRVAFGSREYFDLMKLGPQVSEWLALGSQVQFAIDNTVYEIAE